MNETREPREPDFVDRALHSFDHVLDIIHDKILRPLLLAGRAIAFGLIIVLAVVVLLTVLVIGVVRLLNVYCFAGREWLSYLVIGGLCLIGGLIIWRRRRPARIEQ